MFGAVLNRLATSVRRALSKYAVGTQEPELAFDFIDNEYITNNSTSNFASAITHSRSGNATMTDGYGPELVVNGGFDSDLNSWTGAGWVWTSKGAFDSGSGVTSDLEQDITVESGKTYLIRLQLREISGGSPSIKDGSTVLQQVSSDDFYDIAYIADSSTLELRIQGGNATFYVDNVSVREMPVLKWAPHNLVINSEDSDSATKTSVGVVSDAIAAPNGTITADKVTANSATSAHFLRRNASTTAGQEITLAVFAKAAEYDYIALYAGTAGKGKYFDLNSGAILGNLISAPNDARITDVGDGWYLCEIDVTAATNDALSVYLSDTGSRFSFLGDGSSGVYLWGAHLYRSDLGGMVDNPDRGDSYVPTAVRLTGPELATSTTQSGTITASTTPWYSAEGTGQWSVSNNAVSRASGGTWESIRRSFGMETNKAYVISFDVTGRTTGSVSVYRDFSTVFLSASENGSYTAFFIPVNPTNGDKIQFGSNSFDGTIENISIRETSVRPDTARYLARIGHHVYNGSAWVNEGLLAESEARTNILPKSGEFSTWGTQVKVTVTDDAVISPDGTQSASTVVPTTVSGEHYVEYSLTADTGTFTDSAYVKADGYKRVFIRPVHVGATEGATQIIEFNVEAGTVLNAPSGTIGTIQDVGNGWYRIAATYTVSGTITGSYGFRVQIADNSGIGNYAGDGTSGIQIYGAQREQASTPSSLIPTSGSSVTRAAETFTIPSANLPWPSPNYIGSELVTNGTFDTDSDWTLSTTVSISSGKLNFNAINTNFIGANQSVNFVSGKVYQISIDVDSITSGEWQVFVARTSGDKSVIGGTSAGSFSGIYVSDGTETNFYVARRNATTLVAVLDNVSVREINPLSVSIAMDGRMTYADTDDPAREAVQWGVSDPAVKMYFDENRGTGGVELLSSNKSGVRVSSDGSLYSPDINVPFNISGRFGSTFVNGAAQGNAFTANTTYTALPDLSATDLDLAYDYMGTIGTFRVWDRDIGDDGLIEATNPSLEPSLSLTFEGTGTNSFIVNDWSE